MKSETEAGDLRGQLAPPRSNAFRSQSAYCTQCRAEVSKSAQVGTRNPIPRWFEFRKLRSTR